ncbi:MAG: alpha/beta hydrolase [Tahibacter sp.]
MTALLVPALAGCSDFALRSLDATAERAGIVIHKSVSFDAPHQLDLDVYAPVAAVNAPVVVFFHGGRWQTGNRTQYAFVGRALAAHGIVAILPDYRKFPAARQPEFLSDAARAVAWSRQHARDYGGDPARLFLMGHSSGAHMVAMLATDARWFAAEHLAPRDIAGVIGVAGPYDFLPLTEADLVDLFGNDPAEQQQSQPVNFIDGDEPPFLLLHGNADTTVWPRNSESLARALRLRGVRADLKRYDHIGHSGILVALSRLLRGKAATLADTLEFIRSLH